MIKAFPDFILKMIIVLETGLHYKPSKSGLLLQQQQQSNKEGIKDMQQAGVLNSCRWQSCVNGSSLVGVIINSLKVFRKTKTGY